MIWIVLAFFAGAAGGVVVMALMHMASLCDSEE